MALWSKDLSREDYRLNNINEQDDKGRTALMLAVERGHSAVVAELVKAGADVSLRDKKGMTAVLLAKSYDMVGQLVRDVNDLSREDRSRILWHACGTESGNGGRTTGLGIVCSDGWGNSVSDTGT